MKIFRFEVQDGVEREYPISIEFYLLQPGQTFERFGGRSGGLTVKKTASIISRSISVDWRDVEWDAGDERVWKWIYRLMESPQVMQIPVFPTLKGETE